MPDDALVGDLVEQVLNDRLKPEEVCALTPDLLKVVRERVIECRNLDAVLEEIFPSSSSRGDVGALVSGESRLPTIPGYEVLNVLGHGGIGIIYRARHLKLNRITALKMLLAGEYARPIELGRFMREARAVAALQHHNIVQIYDVGEFDGRPYFTMELMEGGSLAQQIGGMPQDVKRSAELVSSIARAMQVAHQAGILHRDLKPGNILLSADGVPKISDFGLASRFADESSLTGNEARLGTPSYMAPEQVTGIRGANSPGIDIYALGAILYEMLTGKPPFRGATALETQRKVISDEPVRPSRLNPKVPRDLDTICLKCLRKSPADRYTNAAALAEDLDHFLRLEPVMARPTGVAYRTAKWLRRRPAIGVALALGALLLLLAGGDVLWLESQHAHLVSEVDGDLHEVQAMDAAGRWTNANTALRRAEARLDVRNFEDLRARVNEARRNLDLAFDLDAIRLSRATTCALPFYLKRADSDYEAVFRDSVQIHIGSDVEDAAAKVRASPTFAALVPALDDWACTVSDPRRRAWILDVARRSDPDPQGWRDRIRDGSNWSDSATVQDLAANVPAADVPVSTLLVIAERLHQAGKDAGPFLHRMQKEHPADFYANLALGDAAIYLNVGEADLYYRAALAARPEAAVGYSAVGDSLRAQHHYDEAIEYYNKALSLDPNYARARCDLGGALMEMGRFKEAEEMCRESLRLDPHYAWTDFYLGGALRGMGRLDEALQHYAIIYDQAPLVAGVPEAYRATMIQAGRLEEARVIWKTALQRPAAGYEDWTGYPEFCLFIGNAGEYRSARGTILERFGSRTEADVVQQMARTCLLLPASQENHVDLDRATALADLALAEKSSTTWDYPYYLFVKALADYRNGDLDGALKLAGGKASTFMGPCPNLIMAMALKDKGQSSDAERALADAVGKFDWRPESADSRDLWIYHILRREAESKVLPDISALLDGSRRPRDNNERIAMVAACQFQKLNGPCAGTFHDALEVEPNLIETRHLNPGFVAACASSALSLSREGTDPHKAVRYNRAELEGLACRWLNAELQSQMRHVPAKGSAREWFRRELAAWKQDPGLADLRDSSALASAPPELRAECAAFWQSLDQVIAGLQTK